MEQIDYFHQLVMGIHHKKYDAEDYLERKQIVDLKLIKPISYNKGHWETQLFSGY